MTHDYFTETKKKSMHATNLPSCWTPEVLSIENTWLVVLLLIRVDTTSNYRSWKTEFEVHNPLFTRYFSHDDNARTRCSAKISRSSISVWSLHSLYSPNLVTSNFYVIPLIKQDMKCNHFPSENEFNNLWLNSWKVKEKNFSLTVFKNGFYVHKNLLILTELY